MPIGANAAAPEVLWPTRGMRFSVERAHHFINYAKTNGLNLCLAGGACRDTIHNKTPKDFDFFVLGGNEPQDVVDKLYQIGFHTEFTPKYGEGRGNPEFKGVCKGWMAGSNIDIILWEEPASTAEEVVSKFDINLNQYWLGDDGEIKFFEDAPHITGEVKVLREDDAHRVNRICKKLMYNL